MSKIKLLLDVVADMRSLADSIQALADASAQNGDAETSAPPQMKSQKETSAEQELSIQAVRAVLGPLSREGYTEQIRGILQKHGADKLSEIDPGEYAAILKEAEGLKNAAE